MKTFSRIKSLALSSFCLLLLLMLINLKGFAQNVGIGVPVPQQKLDVNGAIKIGTTTTNQPGAIRFNAGKFEGGDGTNWNAFTQLPAGTLVASATNPNAALTSSGFTFFSSLYMDKDTAISTTPNTWLGVQSLNAPETRRRHTAIWTGTKMIVWGGLLYGDNTLVNTGSIYDPATDMWSAMAASPLSSRYAHTAVWTGTHMIIWGGTDLVNPLNNGAAYNPVTNTWALLNTVNAPIARFSHTAIWTGAEMVIWGGTTISGSTNTGSKYNFATNTWTALPTAAGPSERVLHTAIWTGTKMIVWGGVSVGLINDGAIYNNATNTWDGPTSLTNAPLVRLSHTAIWTGTEMIIWGGSGFDPEVGSTGGKYNPSTNTWAATDEFGPEPTSNHSAIWTGSEMIIFGGRFESGGWSNTGAKYNPITNIWTGTLPLLNTPTEREGHTAVWTGNQMIIYGGQNNNNASLNNGRYIINSQANINTLIKSALHLFSKN
jgi:N-acetylneuraminic acid mutarotase